MAALSFIIGVIGNIISVLLFLSPAKTLGRIVKRRSTEEFESLPYISTLLCSSLWTYYGIIRPGAVLVATVNGFGALVQLLYITLFLIYAASPRIRARTSMRFLTINVGFFGAVMLISTFMLHDDDMRINLVGLLGAALNILMYASPLSILREVVTTGSVEYMPFLLSLCCFLNGGVWTFYALLVNDLFLTVPNAMGVILGAIQLIVYAYYWREGQKQLHEAQQHLIPN